MFSAGNSAGLRTGVVVASPGQSFARQGDSGVGNNTDVDGTGVPVADEEVLAAVLAERARQEGPDAVTSEAAVFHADERPIAPAAIANKNTVHRDNTVTPTLNDIEGIRIGGRLHLVADVGDEHRDLTGVRVSDDLMFVRLVSSSERGTQVKEGFMWYSWRA